MMCSRAAEIIIDLISVSSRTKGVFLWVQEHVRSGTKGDIKDLCFSVLTEVMKNNEQTEAYNQKYLNSIEAWWIAKYQEEGYKVKNVTNPKITIEYLQQRFDEMIAKHSQLSLIS